MTGNNIVDGVPRIVRSAEITLKRSNASNLEKLKEVLYRSFRYAKANKRSSVSIDDIIKTSFIINDFDDQPFTSLIVDKRKDITPQNTNKDKYKYLFENLPPKTVRANKKIKAKVEPPPKIKAANKAPRFIPIPQKNNQESQPKVKKAKIRAIPKKPRSKVIPKKNQSQSSSP